jgi:hypothetical protein
LLNLHQPDGSCGIADLLLNLHQPDGSCGIADLLLNRHEPDGSCGIADLLLNLHQPAVSPCGRGRPRTQDAHGSIILHIAIILISISPQIQSQARLIRVHTSQMAGIMGSHRFLEQIRMVLWNHTLQTPLIVSN